MAIDGEVSITNTGFFHTMPETNPWLKVTARETIHVLNVTVSHRIDCCIERFQNARAVLIDIDGNEIQCGDIFPGGLTSADRETTFECGRAVPAISVKIELEGNDRVLQVNELTVGQG